MNKGHNYNIEAIEKKAKDFDAEIHEFGPETIGEHIIMAKDPQGYVATYVLSGASAEGYIYECVYTDY